MSLTVPTVVATRATDDVSLDEESDTAFFTVFIWAILVLGVLVGSSGHHYYLKLVQQFRNVAE